MFATNKRLDHLFIESIRYTAETACEMIDGQEELWDALSELSALVEFLVEKQEKATSKALSGSPKPPTSKGKTAPKTDSKATKKVASSSRTKRA